MAERKEMRSWVKRFERRSVKWLYWSELQKMAEDLRGTQALIG